MSNLCRDESCLVLEDKIESVFGSCFSTHGLGGVLTCGVIGIKAGLSHSPIVGVSASCPHPAQAATAWRGAALVMHLTSPVFPHVRSGAMPFCVRRAASATCSSPCRTSP